MHWSGKTHQPSQTSSVCLEVSKNKAPCGLGVANENSFEQVQVESLGFICIQVQFKPDKVILRNALAVFKGCRSRFCFYVPIRGMVKRKEEAHYRGRLACYWTETLQETILGCWTSHGVCLPKERQRLSTPSADCNEIQEQTHSSVGQRRLKREKVERQWCKIKNAS